MSRIRLTIAQLMAIMLLAGFGFAAMRNANDFWAMATFNLAIGLNATPRTTIDGIFEPLRMARIGN